MGTASRGSYPRKAKRLGGGGSNGGKACPRPEGKEEEKGKKGDFLKNPLEFFVIRKILKQKLPALF